MSIIALAAISMICFDSFKKVLALYTLIYSRVICFYKLRKIRKQIKKILRSLNLNNFFSKIFVWLILFHDQTAISKEAV